MWDYMSAALTANTLHNFEMTWSEGSGGANINLYWSSGTIASTPVPASAFWSKQRVGGTHDIEIANPSVPNQCTIESKPTTHTAGTTYTMTLQSRTALGTAHTVTDDTYTVNFVCLSSDCGSESFSTTATHQGSGLY